MKDLKRKGVALLTAAFTIIGVSGCSIESSENYPSEFGYINQENNRFDEYVKTIIRNGEPVTAYCGENLSLTVNKDTFEAKEYIYHNSSISSQIYDLSTGYMVVDASIFNYSFDTEVRNYDVIKDNNYIVDFVELGDYIEGYELKEWYTLEEIKEIEGQVVESLKKVSEYEKTKVK